MSEMRDFITGILRDMEGNALLLLATGRTEPTATAPHGKLRVNSPHWFAYPSELDRMVEFAEKQRSGEQRNVYISPIIYGDQEYKDQNGDVVHEDRHGRKLYSRSKLNALFSQTVYMDSDACPPEAFRISPSRHVVTSEGHGHDYWFLSQPVPAALAAEIAHKITTAHKAQGCDPSGWSANKVLRLPTLNTTYDQDNPFQITWEDDNVDPQTGEIGEMVYSVEDLQHVYEDVKVDAQVGTDDPIRPVPKLEGLPDFESLIVRIPQSEKRLNELIYKTPKGGDDGWRSEQRYALLLDLQRFGFTDEETVAIAWHSPAASKWREDARGVDGLWWELQARVKPVIADERGENISPAPAKAKRTVEAPILLDEVQRSRVENRSDMLTLYLQYAISKVQTPNMPYHIINGWTLLSLALSEVIEMPKEPRSLGTGIFSFTLGKSSSGKDESKSILTACVHQLYPNESLEIPAMGSKESLIENLVERTDRVSYIQENEADALIQSVKAGGGYLAGVEKYWTRGYDGEVPSLGKIGRKELNKPGMHAIITMHFMGTPSGIFSAIDKQMFYSGWLARQIWVIGDEVETTKETVKSKFRRGDAVKAHDGVPKYLGLQFARLRMSLRATAPLDRKRASLDPTDEAIELMDAMKWKAHQHLAQQHDMELWRPVLNRMGDIMWKIAALSAASAGRVIVATKDVEIAVYYAEIWLGNVMRIAEGISDTFFSKQCDEIEKYISSREAQEADLGSIYRFRRGEPKRVTDEYLQSLTYQGRVIERRPAGANTGNTYFKIKEAKA